MSRVLASLAFVGTAGTAVATVQASVPPVQDVGNVAVSVNCGPYEYDGESLTVGGNSRFAYELEVGETATFTFQNAGCNVGFGVNGSMPHSGTAPTPPVGAGVMVQPTAGQTLVLTRDDLTDNFDGFAIYSSTFGQLASIYLVSPSVSAAPSLTITQATDSALATFTVVPPASGTQPNRYSITSSSLFALHDSTCTSVAPPTLTCTAEIRQPLSEVSFSVSVIREGMGIHFNEVSTGAVSVSLSARAKAPADPTVEARADGTATLSSTLAAQEAGYLNASAMFFEVYDPDDELVGTCTATLPATSCVVSGLVNGVEYYAYAYANDGGGSSSSYVYFTVPSAGSTTNPPPPAPAPTITTTAPTDTAPSDTAPNGTTPSLDPIAPNAGQRPGSAAVTIDGIEVPVTLTREVNTVTLTGDGFGMSLIGLDRNQSAGRLDAAGNLILQAGGFTRVFGSGFAPDSEVKVYLFSDPVQLGIVRTDAAGAFDATLAVPSSTPAGEHTVQANGLTSDGKVRSMNLGVVVPVTTAVLPATGAEQPGVPLAAFLGALGLAALLVSRRRTTA